MTTNSEIQYALVASGFDASSSLASDLATLRAFHSPTRARAGFLLSNRLPPLLACKLAYIYSVAPRDQSFAQFCSFAANRLIFLLLYVFLVRVRVLSPLRRRSILLSFSGLREQILSMPMV